MTTPASRLPDTPQEQLLTIADLGSMSRRQLKVLFNDLEAPRIAEMNGEYESALLNQGSPLARVLIRMVFNAPGRWLGKAFHPVSENEGRGYNSFQTRGGVRRIIPMETAISPSSIYAGNSFTIRYHNLNRGPVRSLVGEVRRVCPGLYLGFGHSFRENISFALSGPVAEFRHEP